MNKRYEIKLPNFEGPLDLLLFLIRKHKIDIYDIPIAFILSEYLKYLSVMRGLNIAIEGAFLEMAATLIQIKLRTLLPRPIAEEEEDPRTELVSNLLEYQKIKEKAELLSNLAEENRYYFYRQIDKLTQKSIKDFAISYEIEQDSGDLYELIKALQKYVIQKPQEIPENITLEKIKVEDKIKEVSKLIKKNKKMLFSDIIRPCSKLEAIAFFLAILELIRMKKIVVFQNKRFSEIYISRR
jgi:segregation and condensation protein A